jgi:hypothetical protein
MGSVWLEAGPGPDVATSLRIQPVEDRRALRQFLLMPAPLYTADPNWVQPLLFERLQHLDPKKNPYFEHAEIAYWLALRGERPVGRISAQVDRLHLERHADATGHFGFLEGEDDGAVFAALFGVAEAWLKARGMRRATGPFSLSINDETGLLIDSFDTPPSIMMGHVPRYYGTRVEAEGYRKTRDLIAYDFDITAPLPPRARGMLERLSKGADLSFRPIEMRSFDQELQTIVDIFNDAWSDNWGFVPRTVHTRLMLACAEICRTSAFFMELGTEFHKRTCAVCAEVCAECAKSCEGFDDMQECAAACRRCAESCRRMAA